MWGYMDSLISFPNSIRIQSVLFPSEGTCAEEQVYYHCASDGNKIDFDGYFNLFYIEKHKKYTGLTRLFLSIDIQKTAEIVLMHDREELCKCRCNPDQTHYEIELPYQDYNKGVFWFRICVAGPVPKDALKDLHINAAYYGIADNYRHVNILADICTYKREEYLLGNIKRMLSFLGKEINRELSAHIQFLIVDNGNTLESNDEIQQLLKTTGKVRVIPNSNTGGAGGFTLGIKEAHKLQKELELTHVILMDDDATYEMDSLVRLYGILCTLKDEYKDLTLGGAMWRSDHPFIQHACGEWYKDHSVYNYNPFIDLRSYEECTQDYMCSTALEYRMYSGWWLCCYSLNVVNPGNMPLSQFFVHLDDVEFGVRNRKKGNPIAFFNGIGVWHKSFDLEFAGWKKYYDIRNDLFLTDLYGTEKEKRTYLRHIRKQMTGQLFNMRYLEMHLTYLAAKDYQKGWEWLNNLDVEKYHKKIYELAKRHSAPVKASDLCTRNKKELLEQVRRSKEDGFSLIEINSIKSEVHKRQEILDIVFLNLKKPFLNGWLLPPKRGTCLILPTTGFWKKNFRYERSFFIPYGKEEGIVRKRDYRQMLKFLRMYISLKRKDPAHDRNTAD